MAYYIQKPSSIDNNIMVFYTGGNRWSDDKSEVLKFSTKKEANSLITNPDGKNGGWSNANVVSE